MATVASNPFNNVPATPLTSLPTSLGSGGSLIRDTGLASLSVAQVCAWLREHGFADHEKCFEKHAISGACLKYLTHELLAEMGVAKVGVQKRILMLISSHTNMPFGASFQMPPITSQTAPPFLASTEKFRIEPRSSSSNNASPSPYATLGSAKYASLDRLGKRDTSKAVSPAIAPRSSSKNVGSGGTLLRGNSSGVAGASNANSSGNMDGYDMPSSDSPTTPQPRAPLPFPMPGSSYESNAGYMFKPLDGKSRLGQGSQPIGGGAEKSKFRTLQQSASNPMLQVSTMGDSSSSLGFGDRVYIRVQDGNHEGHRIEITSLAGDAAAIRRAIFRKFHIPEESQRAYALFQGSTGSGSSTMTDEDLLRLFSRGGGGLDNPYEMTLRKTFSYPKRSLEGPLNGGSSGSFATGSYSLAASSSQAQTNMMFNGPLANVVPVQVLQQEQKQQQTVAAAAKLAKSLIMFGLLGTGSEVNLNTAAKEKDKEKVVMNDFSAGNSKDPSEGALSNLSREAVASSNSSSGATSSGGYFDAPPRSKKSLSVRISGGGLQALQKQQQLQQQQLQQQQQLRGSMASDSNGIKRSSKRASVKSSRKSLAKGGVAIPPRGSRVVALIDDEGDESSTNGGGAGRRGSKFKSFFAERPQNEAIADKLKKYFPMLSEDENGAASSGGEESAGVPGVVKARKEGNLPPSQLVSSVTVADGNVISPSKLEIPRRSKSIKNKVEEAARENRRKSVMSTIAVRRRLSVAASALLKEEDAEAVVGGIQKRRGVSSVRIGTGKSGSASSSATNTPMVTAAETESATTSLPRPAQTPESPATPGMSPGPAEAASSDSSYSEEGDMKEKIQVVGSVAGRQDSSAPSSATLVIPIVVTEKRASVNPLIRWTQGKMIGQGAFGKVFLALNMDTGDIMAVKQVLLGPSSAMNGKLLNAAAEANKKKQTEALERELEVLKELEHENIVRYLGFELKDGSLNVFLQYVSGGSIASLLSKTGKLDMLVARYFTFQILCGMAYLHSKNIIHRDVKGANILVDADGICKISDFGTSKKNSYQMAYQRVTRMSMQGTIPWMAPEVAKGKGYSAKVDIWSVTCMVLEMMTGLPPWHKVSASIIYLLGTGNSPPIAEDLPQLAKNFLKAGFVIDPEKRPTALELVDHEFCRLSKADSESLDFKAWVLVAEERRAAELAENEEEESDYTDSDEDDSADDSAVDSDEESVIDSDDHGIEIEEV